ncbi:family 43 glycosylhydrolase, partial [Vibrio parahaemolyticus]|nr:family 43 glycosylhydrolase [Vibrio parahaemolyticus]
QIFNPYLPCYEYVPDAEPRVFGDRVYIYGSHDCFDGDKFCMNDYVCWSAPVDDLGNWKYEGIIYEKIQEPSNKDEMRNLFAPDVEKGPDGRYYLYYSMMGIVSVAVCDSPAGKYEFLGYVQHPDKTPLGRKKGDNVNFDPAIFVDEDNRIFLYSGVVSDLEIRNMIKENGLLADGSYCIEIESDMLTVKHEPILVVPAEGEDYAGHVFFEGSSLRKIKGRYYFVYSSRNGHELCYAISDTPNGKFVFGGRW